MKNNKILKEIILEIKLKEEERKIKQNFLLTEKEKDKLLNILKVKKNLIKNDRLIGIPANFFEENFLKHHYPTFYKMKVKKRKRKTDKKGLPESPYVYLPRTAF